MQPDLLKCNHNLIDRLSHRAIMKRQIPLPLCSGFFYFLSRKEKETMRIRTLPQALDEIKAKDPNTALTHYTLQRWVKSGDIPSSKRGTHFLIDLDELEKCLERGIK